MRRPAIPLLTCVLATVTALALLGAATTLRPPPVATNPAGASRAVVHRFYDAVNDVLRTGDASALDAVVAAYLVTHPGALPDTHSGLPGLERHLAALRASYPALRLTVEDLIVEGDRAVARVRSAGVAPGEFLGLPLADTSPPWGTVDLLWLADGRIAEFWSVGGAPVLVEELQRIRLGSQSPSRPVVALARTTFAPGGWEARVADEERILYVETGALAVTLDARFPAAAQLAWVRGEGPGGPADPLAPGAALTVPTGGLVALPAGSHYAIRNEGGTPAVALDLTLIALVAPIDLAYPGGGPTPTGRIVVRPLAGWTTTDLASAASTRIAFGRATLAPEATLALGDAVGPVLLAVERGTVVLATGGGGAWVQSGQQRANRKVTAARLDTGDGSLVPLGTAVTLRASGAEPAAILVVTITPDGGLD